ncbi:AMIN-like domain-containing (lipo)protein [Allokutzneria oryzae]|uniref:AMIN-like domain-containing protein n=1 Tax=Allokutzneria oryzae TaxID=1378989 RepID=A0ABV6A3G8_9PSEU
MRVIMAVLALFLVGSVASASTATPAQVRAPGAIPNSDGAAVLSAIRVGSHPGHDRVVFEFDGALPTYHAVYVDQVTRDGSGEPVSLRGNAFLQLTMHNATLDNSFQVTDPRDVRRYEGPRRIATPGLPLVRELAEAGDFEADLTFGIGIDRQTPFRVLLLTSPTRVVVDFSHG